MTLEQNTELVFNYRLDSKDYPNIDKFDVNLLTNICQHFYNKVRNEYKQFTVQDVFINPKSLKVIVKVKLIEEQK